MLDRLLLGRVVRRWHRRRDVERFVSLARSQVVDRDIARDGQQPGGEPGDVTAIAVPRAPGLLERLRGQVLGNRVVAQPVAHTGGETLVRDADVLSALGREVGCSVCMSVPTVDQEAWAALEPGTAHPLQRLRAVRKLREAGGNAGVLMAPVLPFISDGDEMLEETVRAIASAGATHIAPIVLHLRKGGSREWFLRWLKEHHPDLVTRYQELYGDRAYAPKSYQSEISEKVGRIARKHRVGRTTGRRARSIEHDAPHPEQLRLA